MAGRPPADRGLLEQAWALHQRGQLDQAWGLYARVLARNPRQADALHLSGIIAGLRNDPAEALRRIGLAVEVSGGNPLYLVNLSNALETAGRLAEAEQAVRRAIAAAPRLAAAHNQLGNLLWRQRRDDEAIVAFDAAVCIEPGHGGALLSLGRLLLDRRRRPEAIAVLRRATAVVPGLADAWLHLAEACYGANLFAEALAATERALTIAPQSAAALAARGNVLGRLYRFADAVADFRRALAIDPAQPLAGSGLAAVLERLGRIDEAIAALDRELEIRPQNAAAFSHRLFLLNYSTQHTAAAIAAAHRQWDERYGLPLATQIRAHANPPDGERRLRIGYVSADLRAHSVAFFFLPLLAGHDRRGFETFCYSGGVDADSVTAGLRALADHWREVADDSDADLANRIRADGIDILVDLSGHTAGNRLRCFALRPAPVQLSYLGYPNTTGLSAIDYRLSDGRADPVDDPVQGSEEILRLPDCFHCYQPPAGLPEPEAPPCTASGRITFASFNVLGKITPPLIAAWAEILRRVPDSVLLLKTKGLSDPAIHAAVVDAFAAQAIGRERLCLAGHDERQEDHLQRYRDVDIGLDTHPYNGTTTTCDALWMGVPVLTWRGDRHSARVGASLLSAIGAPELIADSADDYVARAVGLAADRARLARYHRELRDRLRASPLTDAARFTGHVEAAYRDIWRRWCATRDGDALATPHWRLALAGGVTIKVPATVEAFTPYALLEQEDWFEDEIGFVRDLLQPGMRVVDIGANYGLYTLAAGRRVGPGGRVWAFEPAPNTRRFLAASVADNGFAHVTVESPALSDADGEVWMALEANPELNRIVTGPDAAASVERIAVTRLDDWAAGDPDKAPDFIKLDAEGHERHVLRGGARLLAANSPLILFEFKHGLSANQDLLGDFAALGYGCYRLLPGLGVLAPFSPAAAGDGFALNLFACKPDRAAALAAAGRLGVADATADLAGVDGLAAIAGLPYAQACRAAWQAAPLADAVRRALAAHAVAVDRQQRPGQRLAALTAALDAARAASAAAATPTRLGTLARIAWSAGRRELAVDALRQAIESLDAGATVDVGEPFLPPSPRFDAVAMSDPAAWLRAATIERFVQLRAFSGYFAGVDGQLELIARVAAAGMPSPELERRRQLLLLRAGRQAAPQCHPLLAERRPDNLNPAFWCG